jgi:DNA polymerase III delta subunit
VPHTQKTSFLLVTGDEFLRKKEVDRVLEKLLPAPSRVTNLTRVYPDELNWAALLEQAKTPSLLGGMQVYLLLQINQLKKQKKEDWALFESYLEHPAEDSFFVIEADELPKSHPLLKLVSKSGKHINLQAKGGEMALGFLQDKMRRVGKKLTPDAWRILVEKLGGAPKLLDLCLDQLILYSNNETIDGKQVISLATEWLKYDPFELTEALAECNGARAITLFNYFFELSGDVMNVIGLIHWQLRRLWQAKQILVRGGQPPEIGRALGIPSFRLRAFVTQANRFELETLERLLRELWEIDWKSKTGGLDSKIAMEAFLAGAKKGSSLNL